MSPRGVALARAGWGGVLLTAARTVRGREGVVFAGLGVRHLLQAAVVLAWPRSRGARWAWVPDVAHGVSMVGLAGVSRRWRTPALVGVVEAAAWAGAARTSRP
ncbi:hypothetical protein AB0F91_40280 [Amycolatopsis sp. NPDC023774]|uniref:hypothetical protein n=1 Tax=Amycolatopsis sp. NPDC023774 TaxID=3155015 RepID=UPI00340C25D3